MFALAVRMAFTASAALALLAAWLIPIGQQSVARATPFSKVLQELRGTSTLRLQLVKGDQTSEILVRTPGLIRKQDSPERYQIAAGSRLWQIDESQNTVVESDSPWFLQPDQQIDLLGLLDVGVTDGSSLLTARPVEQTKFAGRDCLAYRVELPGKGDRIQINAFADAANQQLVGIIARAAGERNPVGPPLAELRLLAMNQPVADEKFVVARSLTEDGRIGKVGDAQGIVVLRPMLASRWTPVCRETLLRPGDWLRTELRGANAVRVTLTSDVVLTLGPATLIECLSPSQARLHSGQVQVQIEPVVPAANAAADKPQPARADTQFTLLAPREGQRQFQAGAKQLVRVDRDEKIVDVPQTPVWLAGFEGTTSNESLGSLIVNLPDGRNEPMTVGYHKVSVEIRDQIARTTIEESFVNHTPGRLEGVFHFPLPQEASISGFGMWIGNDLMEADVVEKQRAREIYETILRERRDPGLLEWTAGNIFKARVFPIEPHSEKRIKIVYTQVLPLRANRYRYTYGLHSELLRTRPLRELSLTVTVNSALPLKSVSCPTHSVRTQQTPHSAQVEFTAQEYTPTRDFEVVCEINGNQSDVVLIPHRRGDDGYFLVQVTPPAANGNWQRDLLPDGKPLKVVLLCDTSASMDAEKRKQQADFVGTVLSSLGADDQFQVACADVGTAWVFAEPVKPTADNVAKAKTFLDERISLGWTDLDRAFADVLKKSPPDAQVIYIGDGIVTAGSTDPAAFVKRLGQLLKEPAQRAFHAVTVGNSNEAVVLKGIATVGGGSTRAISGEQTPQVVAMELLNEFAQPGLREMAIEFRGLKVAAVYPGQLPNLAAGTQQVVVGRYLPEGKDQTGEIIVTGLRGGEKVKYAARVNLKDAEEGNSFIPRLWARSHLDHLLAQGQNAAVRDEVIRLSEEFHIITPYTSLLVLETDADRERFGVQRRYEMRDGERFFAEGRNNANFDLLQAQMKRAGTWRLDLRRQILLGLRGLGRDTQAFRQEVDVFERKAGWPRSLSSPFLGRPMSGPMGGAGAGGYPGSMAFNGTYLGVVDDSRSLAEGYFLGDELSAGDEMDAKAERASVFDGEQIAGEPQNEGKIDGKDKLEELSFGVGLRLNKRLEAFDETPEIMNSESAGTRFPSDSLSLVDELGELEVGARQLGFGFRAGKPMQGYRSGGWGMGGFGGGGAYFSSPYWNPPDYTSWVNTLFPALESRPRPPAPPAKDSQTWSAEALAVSRSLLRTESLQTLEGGIELRRVTEQMEPRWNRRTYRNSDLVLYSPAGWLTRGRNPREQTVISYCTPQERGIYSLAFLLGRSRASADFELKSAPFALEDASLSPLHELYGLWTARVEPAGENKVTLILASENGTSTLRLLIDADRKIVLKQESIDDGKSTSSLVFDDFVQVAGRWWARKSTRQDAKGRTTAQTTIEIDSLTAPQHAERMAAELAAKPTVQFVRLPFVRLKVARQAVADGAAAFDDRLAMILHNAEVQQWDDMWKHVDAAEKLAADKPGIRWLRTTLLGVIRRNDEARQKLIEEAKQILAKPQNGQAVPDELFLVEHVLRQIQGLSSWAEFRDVVELVKPIYERQPAELEMMPQWTERLAQCADGLGRHEEMLALRRSLAETAPWDISKQVDYARRLAQAGQFDAAHAWLRRELDKPAERTPDEVGSLCEAIADTYRQQARWPDLLKFTTEWMARQPESMSYNSAYAQHLAAVVYNDQMDAANALVEQWLRDSRVDGKLPNDRLARVEAAMNYVLGNTIYLSFRRMDDRWIGPLAEMVRFFARHPQHSGFAARALGHHFFSQSDAADRLRGEFLKTLQTDLAKLTPGQIGALVGWTLSGRMELAEPLNGRKQLDASEIPLDIWKGIAAELKSRWDKSQEKTDRHQLGDTLQSIYSQRFQATMLLPFLRERIATAHRDFKQSYISTLFENLLSTAWSPEIEQEAFATLLILSDAIEPLDRLAVQAPALYRLVDAMLANRQAAEEKKLADQGGQDKLTRKELASKKADIIRTVRTELAARLDAASKQQDGALSPWLKIEQTWLNVQLNQDLPQVEQFCWQILGDAPVKIQKGDDDDDVSVVFDPIVPQIDAETRSKLFEIPLKKRALVTLMRLASRKGADAAGVDRLLKYFDAGIAQGGDTAATWRTKKFQMLVTLDRPDDLDRQLREWIRGDVSTGPWRQSLARLVAERGKLDEAIQLFEACEKDKLLSAADYRLLSDWYLLVNRRDAYERSRVESFKQMPEGALSQRIHRVRQQWFQHQQQQQSGELDETSLFVFKALFEKSANPENYLWQLREAYSATRDFRLLQMLPDAVLGRSPQQIYSYLQNLNSQLLYELRNEATADEILSRVRKLREGDRTTTDRRALDLLEALVERKSSEILNQPGPHVDLCLAALRRAFDREWSDGEPRLMASFLYGLGGLSQPKLMDEQLRELRALQKLTPAPGRDHLYITNDLCNLLGWNYSRRDEALREMEAEVRAYEQMHNGLWPHQDNHVLGSYISLYEGGKRHTTGETILQNFLAHPEHAEQRKWLNDRLMSLYNHALEHDGAVSLGTGRARLFDPIFNLNLKQLDAAIDENERYNLVSRLTTTLDIAQRHQLAAGKAAAIKVAFEVMPGVLRQQTAQYQNTAVAPLDVIARLAGDRVALQYVVERMEQYPQRLEISWNNSWQVFGYQLAYRRNSAGPSEFDARILKLAIAELQRGLRTGEGANQWIFHRGYQYFWQEKADDFAKGAEAILADRRSSGRTTMTVAQYLWNGLSLQDRAIELLLIAHKNGLLEESSQVQLVQWLHERNRHAESIPLLEPLVAARPDQIHYRTLLMVAYFRSVRLEQLADLIQQTHDYFHDGGPWNEGNIGQFARGCFDCAQPPRAVMYYTEAIALHQRANPGSGLNDATLSDYYHHLALANSQLGQTKAAVDAASAAVVCWGARHDQRAAQLAVLDQVLRSSKDLDGYVKEFDQETAKTGQDSPILRKAIGTAYQAHGDYAKAIPQLLLASELQPNDTATRQALILCYDAVRDAPAATRQLLKLIDVQRHDLTLYQQLANRLKDDEAEAERAATSIIEAGPNEAENHTAMAELRQKQNRWDEAIPHWEHVAELRRLEPTGLLKLAEAQLHQKQWDAAKKSLDKLRTTEWPARFNDVQPRTRQLESQLPK